MDCLNESMLHGKLRAAEEGLIGEVGNGASNPADASRSGAAQTNPIPLPVLVVAALEGGGQSKCCLTLSFVN